ncbi:zona pellucida sperm-binding protein 3 receptor-like [Manis pentadactyla]|uniref:zona pellucida sperm-binding protein 3 receptor-like n=1 Tax=Manis pentadactyla TaxID=143292 RepID=UPI00255C3B7B|nr:zona pellucida sperm-binding protein 3 receptor-like [Manis pentadactyla]
MQLPKVPHGSLERKENMAAWSLPRPGRVSDPTLFQMTLVATLLATVLGDCGPPPDLLFASPINKLHKMDFKTGTVLKYTCHPGYSRIGSSRVTCNAKGLWDYSVFCIKKRCRNPGDLPNGKVEVKTDFLFGSVIEFSCSEGYILIGPTTSHCEIQDKGVDWSDDFPQCVIAKCEPPPAIRNGRHSGGDEDFYPYGSSVTYSCDPDFSLLGQASISCTVENKTLGVWSPSPPTCENIVCHQPLVPNGIFVSGFGPLYSYRDSIVFNCKKGYLMNGSSLIRCEADNKWHPSPPICELNSCIDLPKIPYASWERRACNLRNQEVFEIGTVLKYQCKLGYRPTVDEPLTVTCQKNLTWTTSKGCERVCCPTPKLENIRITRGRRHFSDRCVYAYEDHVSYVCDDGYYPVSPDGKSSCRADGKWRPEMPACEPAMCLKPEIKNGKLSVDKDQYVTPENVIIHCDSGYDLVGSQNITCSKNRTWYPEVPKCEWVYPEGCEQVLVGRALMQCLPNPKDVKLALEVYKLSLEVELLERQRDKAKRSTP